jgi:hypothetical protein
MEITRGRRFRPRVEGLEDRRLLSLAVVEIVNKSTYTIKFDFRWTPSSQPKTITEAPGQGEIYWATYSNALTPQVQYYTTTSANSQTTVSLAQGYGQWTGTGTPPVSSATHYQFENTSTGVELYYAPDSPTPTPAPAPSVSSSPNWSGYVVSSNFSNPWANSVTAVSGSWNVPSVSGPAGRTFDSSTWIGIDGYDNQTVEQLGTEQDVVNGIPVYRAWWEMYSSGFRQPEQIITSMTIFPGDSISASVQYITSGIHAGQFYLSIVDNSRPNDSFSTYQSSSQTQSPLAQRSTAEWIMEAPSVGDAIAQMPTFSTVHFTNATAVINGVGGTIGSPSWQSKALNLVSDGVPIDTTSDLGGSGSGFSVSSNFGVSAGIETARGLLTDRGPIGSDNPQVIVVGRQTPQPSAPPPNVTDTGGHLQSVVAGHGEVFGLTEDNTVWIYNDATGWTNTHGFATSIAVGTDRFGNDELWAISGGNALWRYTSAEGWFNTGGSLKSVVAGHGEVFGLTFDNTLWVYNDDTGWTNTGGHALSIAVGTDLAGNDEVWVVAGDLALWRYDQGLWFNTQGHLKSIVAGHGEVFGPTDTNALWVYNDNSDWANIQVNGTQIALGTDALGVDDLWVLDPTGELLRYRN